MLEHYDAIETLADIADYHARRNGARIALTCEERRLSYEGLAERSRRVAHGLVAAKVERGARVGLLARDSESTYEILLGCARIGAVMVPINWRLPMADVAHIVGDSEMQVLFVGAEWLPRIEDLRRACPRLRRVIAVDGVEQEPGFDAWREQQRAEPVGWRSNANDAIVQVYTSGTTGRSKGVVISHDGLLALLRGVERSGEHVVDWQPGDVTLLALPAFHVGGLWFGVHGLLNGVENVIMRGFNAALASALIEKHAITKLALVPAMLRFMLSEPAAKTADLSSVNQLIYGGSPMPRPLLASAQQLFKCRFCQNYGLSETSNMAVFLPEAERVDPARPAFVAAGKPLPGVRVRIIDSEGEELPRGQTGEICFNTPSQMLEYWKQPLETARTLVQGWVHTGDAGYLDADGYLYVTDRLKDLIISAGENIYPAELERILGEHEDISDVAVIGIPDERWGEAPIAFVVKRAGSTISKRDVMGFARQRLASYQMLQSVEFMDVLPRNPSGKVLKRELREPYWAARDKGVN